LLVVGAIPRFRIAIRTNVLPFRNEQLDALRKFPLRRRKEPTSDVTERRQPDVFDEFRLECEFLRASGKPPRLPARTTAPFDDHRETVSNLRHLRTNAVP
jgi:hypothetical protein